MKHEIRSVIFKFKLSFNVIPLPVWTYSGMKYCASHVSGGRGFVWGFREGWCELSSRLSQPGEKSC